MPDLFTHLNSGLRDRTSMDIAHAALIASMVLSLKPARVLELGIGTGYLTKALLLALRTNGQGSLLCVDNWHDWDGRRPEHINELEEWGAKVVVSSEEVFVRSCEREQFDLVVSDADHFSSYKWFEGTLGLVARDGVAFFHDTNQPDNFPGLAELPRRAKELGLPYYHYAASDGESDRCHRGLLMVLNGRGDGPITSGKVRSVPSKVP
jgi:predicted O-methyltransferase YrrM